jgi:hypothetical protein
VCESRDGFVNGHSQIEAVAVNPECCRRGPCAQHRPALANLDEHRRFRMLAARFSEIANIVS